MARLRVIDDRWIGDAQIGRRRSIDLEFRGTSAGLCYFDRKSERAAAPRQHARHWNLAGMVGRIGNHAERGAGPGIYQGE